MAKCSGKVPIFGVCYHSSKKCFALPMIHHISKCNPPSYCARCLFVTRVPAFIFHRENAPCQSSFLGLPDHQSSSRISSSWSDHSTKNLPYSPPSFGAFNPSSRPSHRRYPHHPVFCPVQLIYSPLSHWYTTSYLTNPNPPSPSKPLIII